MVKNKVKAFAKEHRKEVIAGAAVIVLSAVAGVILKKSIRIPKETILPMAEPVKEFLNENKDIEVPAGFSVGSISDLFEYKDEIVAIATDLTVNDLGKFGEELVKHGLVADGAEAAITAEFARNI